MAGVASSILISGRWPGVTVSKAAELDDHEYLVYVKLRAWRLARKRELMIEPYKICQNRTLCELIRRRRNDAAYGVGGVGKVESDLLECWGLGPSKARPDGYGPEMLVQLDDDEATRLFAQSRLLTSSGAASADADADAEPS